MIFGSQPSVRVCRPSFALCKQNGNGKRARRASHRRECESFDAIFRLWENLQRVEFGAGRERVVDPMCSVRREPFCETLDDARAAVGHELCALGRKPGDKPLIDRLELAEAQPSDLDVASAKRGEARRDIADDFDRGHRSCAVWSRAIAGDFKRCRRHVRSGEDVRRSPGHVV